MVPLNFNLVFEGVYCLATKPQSTLPNDLIMQPVTLRYAHKASDMNSHTNYTKVSTFNSEYFKSIYQSYFFITISFAINMNKDSNLHLSLSLEYQHTHRN